MGYRGYDDPQYDVTWDYEPGDDCANDECEETCQGGPCVNFKAKKNEYDDGQY